MKQILVTGGAGFVGSYLCETLLEQGHRVICLDTFLTSRKENIATHLKHKHFTFVEQDVTLPFDFEVDEIYNLASPASPLHYQRDPILTTKINVLGALNVLALAEKRGARVLQASTSEVYGDPAVHPQVESYFGNVNPIGPRACYDEGKRVAETLFFDMHRTRKVNITIARIFNTYGPRMQEEDGRVVSNFILQALSNAPITLYGDGNQTRSFCYVDDLVDGLICLMESTETGPINLGNPEEHTVKALAEKIIEMTGSSSTCTYEPLPEDDPKVRCPSIDRARKQLGWAPNIPLEKGLSETIAYFQQIGVVGKS